MFDFFFFLTSSFFPLCWCYISSFLTDVPSISITVTITLFHMVWIIMFQCCMWNRWNEELNLLLGRLGATTESLFPSNSASSSLTSVTLAEPSFFAHLLSLEACQIFLPRQYRITNWIWIHVLSHPTAILVWVIIFFFKYPLNSRSDPHCTCLTLKPKYCKFFFFFLPPSV